MKKRYRQKKRWEDNIKEWTGIDLPPQLREHRTGRTERDSCEVNCGAPTTLKGYGID